MNPYLKEGIEEIIDLIEQSVTSSLNIESSLILEKPILENDYRVIVRNLHSIKGASGILGLTELMEFIHKIESEIIEIKAKHDFNLKFIDQIIKYHHIIVDYLEGDNNALLLFKNINKLFDISIQANINDEEINDKRELRNIRGTKVAINRLKKFGEEYLATADDYKPSVIHIDSSISEPEKSIIDSSVNKSKIYHFNSINEIYANSFIFNYNQFFLINLEGLRTNPFFLQKICSIFKKEIEFFYYSKDIKTLEEFSREMDENYIFHHCLDLEEAVAMINKKIENLTSF